MPTLAKSRCALMLAAIACVPSACTGAGGTPTPEPPDFLPTPTLGEAVGVVSERLEGGLTVPIAGNVAPGADAWIVDLDTPTVAPQRVRTDAEGGFIVTLEGVRDGDRIQVVARSATRHSLPLALFVQAGEPGRATAAIAAPASALGCLTVAPRDALTEVVESEASYARAFTLTNRCSEPVRIERAALRLGDQGFSVLPPIATLAPGAEARVPVTFEGHDLPTEQADVLLLDVAAGAQRGRYALGVYSVSASSLGKP